MRPIVTDGVAWSVCQSVSLSRSWALQKRLSWSRYRLGCAVGWIKGTIIRWGTDSPTRRGNEGKSGCPFVKYRDSLPWVAQKRLNRSSSRFGFGLGWAQGSMYYAGCTLPDNGTTWRIPVNRPRAAAMRPVVRFLWPLVLHRVPCMSSQASTSSSSVRCKACRPCRLEICSVDSRASWSVLKLHWYTRWVWVLTTTHEDCYAQRSWPALKWFKADDRRRDRWEPGAVGSVTSAWSRDHPSRRLGSWHWEREHAWRWGQSLACLTLSAILK